MERLNRFSRQYSWNEHAPELDSWQPDIINTAIGVPAPFTKRVAAIFNHACLRRLKSELQLGWVKEVYPSATHNRWSHTIGVFAGVVAYYNALLADPEVPTLRVLLDPADLSHVFIAAIIHDIGHSSFAHDIEAATPHIYNHEGVVERLLDEDMWGIPTLRQAIEKYWPSVNLNRVLSILYYRKRGELGVGGEAARAYRAVDGIAADVIDGPIDADKFDYLRRDSMATGAPYGHGVDPQRLVQALSVDAKESGNGCRLALAYKAKGGPAIESLLLARYQMYGSVYWHHTFRCIQAMFVHAVAATFSHLKDGKRKKLNGVSVTANIISDLIYHRVICKKNSNMCKDAIGSKSLPDNFFEEGGNPLFENDIMLNFVWVFADQKIRRLLERLARRELFKRIFEVKIGDLGELGDYSGLRSELMPERRIALAEKLEVHFLDAVLKAMSQRGPRDSVSESEAKRRHGELMDKTMPRIVIDFPIRGVPEERNFPNEISDPLRKYLAGPLTGGRTPSNVFHVVRQLQTQIASVRIFAAPELHELITRYLDPSEVHACVESEIKRLRIHR